MKCTNCSKEHQNNNTGCDNSGYYNSGYRNSGDYNSGNYNSGYYNSGYRNSGDYNSGNYNSGYYNSGYRNSGYRNSGWFNTNEPKMRFFNKDSDLTYSEFSAGKIVYPNLKVCSWVDIKHLPENEKDEETIQRGGKLKTLTYKEAWAEYWGRASEKDKQWFQNLPNFDPEIFKEITGVDVESKETIEIGGIKYDKAEVEKRLRDIKPLK